MALDEQFLAGKVEAMSLLSAASKDPSGRQGGPTGSLRGRAGEGGPQVDPLVETAVAEAAK